MHPYSLKAFQQYQVHGKELQTKKNKLLILIDRLMWHVLLVQV
jgi:hypothetical protein